MFPEKTDMHKIFDDLNALLECLHNRFNFVTDRMLMESIIHEIKAAELRYSRLLAEAKEAQRNAAMDLDSDSDTGCGSDTFF